MSDIIPENILVNADAWLDAKDSKLIVGFDTLYCLKSTVDARRAEDSNTIRGLESDLEMSDESIRLSREHLKKAGISAAFFDDCAALAAKKILDQQETIRELAAVLEFLIGDIYWRENSPALDYLIKTLNDNDKQITESKEGEK